MIRQPRYSYAGVVNRWVDGDTVDVTLDLGFHLTARLRVRLLGIDTPERGQPGYREATAAAERLAPPGETLVVSTLPDGDKWGRWLARIASPSTEDIAGSLIASGFGVAYDGGARRTL